MSKPNKNYKNSKSGDVGKKNPLQREESHAMENLWRKKKMGEKRTENESLEHQHKKMKRGAESEEEDYVEWKRRGDQ